MTVLQQKGTELLCINTGLGLRDMLHRGREDIKGTRSPRPFEPYTGISWDGDIVYIFPGLLIAQMYAFARVHLTISVTLLPGLLEAASAIPLLQTAHLRTQEVNTSSRKAATLSGISLSFPLKDSKQDP